MQCYHRKYIEKCKRSKEKDFLLHHHHHAFSLKDRNNKWMNESEWVELHENKIVMLHLLVIDSCYYSVMLWMLGNMYIPMYLRSRVYKHKKNVISTKHFHTQTSGLILWHAVIVMHTCLTAWKNHFSCPNENDAC